MIVSMFEMPGDSPQEIHRPRPVLRRLVVAAAILGAAALSTKWILESKLLVPYGWIGGIGALTCLCLFTLARRGSRFRFLWLNAFAVVATLTCAEWILALTEKEPLRTEVHSGNKSSRLDPYLGYVREKNLKYSRATYYQDELIHDVTYTTDAHGWRVSPACNEDSAERDVLFFGGSFCFGLGVEDNETVPHLVGVSGEGAYCVQSFSNPGWGAHEMLSGIEHGFVETAVEHLGTRPMTAVYIATPDHVRRAVAPHPWFVVGPRYVRRDEELIFTGSFEQHGWLSLRTQTGLQKSRVARRFLTPRSTDADDVELYLDIVATAAARLRTLVPASDFHVIVWNKWRSQSDPIIHGLKERGLNVHLASDALPGFKEERLRYRLSPHDSHPNTAAYEGLARYILDEILR